MSSKLAMAILESDLPAHLKPTAATLALFANDAGDRIYPSVARLAWLVGKTPRRITADLSALCGVGVLVALTPRSGGGASTQYHLDVDALPQRPGFVNRRRRQGLDAHIPLTSTSALQTRTPDVSDTDPRRLEHRPLTPTSETPDAHVSRSFIDLSKEHKEEQHVELPSHLRKEIISIGKQVIDSRRKWSDDSEFVGSVIERLQGNDEYESLVNQLSASGTPTAEDYVRTTLMMTWTGYRLRANGASR